MMDERKDKPENGTEEKDLNDLLKAPKTALNNIGDKLGQVFQRDFLRYLFSVLLYFVLFSLVFFALFKSIAYTLPFIIALIIAALMQPLMRLMVNRLKWKKGIASAVLLVFLILLIVGLLILLIVKIISDAIGIVDYLVNYDYADLWQTIQYYLRQLPLNFEDLQLESFIQRYGEQLGTVIKGSLGAAGNVLSIVWRVISAIPSIVMMVLVVIFASYYFTKDWTDFKEYPRIIFAQKIIDGAKKLQTEGISMLGRYIVAYLKLVLATTLQCMVIFLLLGVPYPFLFAALAGFFDLLPVVGASLVYIPLAIYFAAQGNWLIAILLIAGLALISIVHQFLEARWVSESIEVHPLLMISVFFFGLRSGSAMLMIYLLALVIGYKLLVQCQIISSPFIKLKKEKARSKRKGKWLDRLRKKKEQE